jgi:LacI family transcriptional regulator
MAQAKRVTIKDVAKAASVSPTAVSRHLNRQISLPPATAQRIDRAVAALGYYPNQLARNLSRGQSGMLGLVTPDIANPFFAQLASAAAEEALTHGFQILLCSTQNDPERELAYLELLNRRQLDGLVVLTSCAVSDNVEQHLAEGARVVLVDEDTDLQDVPKVFVENQQGGYLATSHLLTRGHTRVAHIGGPTHLFSAQERYAGYAAALTEKGLPLESDLARFGLYTESFGYEAARWLLELAQPPSAIFAASDYVALGVLRYLKERVIKVPDDISLVGFDDILLAGLLQPALTTVRQPIDRLAREGIRLLAEEILSGTNTDPKVLRLPVELIERDSVRSLNAA